MLFFQNGRNAGFDLGNVGNNLTVRPKNHPGVPWSEPPNRSSGRDIVEPGHVFMNRS